MKNKFVTLQRRGAECIVQMSESPVPPPLERELWGDEVVLWDGLSAWTKPEASQPTAALEGCNGKPLCGTVLFSGHDMTALTESQAEALAQQLHKPVGSYVCHERREAFPVLRIGEGGPLPAAAEGHTLTTVSQWVAEPDVGDWKSTTDTDEDTLSEMLLRLLREAADLDRPDGERFDA